MKKVLAIFAAACALVFVSCESTKQEPAKEQSAVSADDQKEAKKDGAPQQQGNSSAAQFKKLLQESSLSVVSYPKETIKGRAFASPYKIQILNEAGAPVQSVKIIAEYPASRSGESIGCEKAELVSDEKGQAEFLPPVPPFAGSEKVTFYPEPPSSDPELARLASASAVEAPWKARTNLGARTGILVSIVDYRQNGSINFGNGAQPSAQALTSNFWRAGLMGAQNADFHNSVDADDPARIRSDALKQLNGNSLFKFVVYGRVKYSEPISKDADGYYKVSFSGTVGAVNISTGEVVAKAAKTVSVKDKAEWKAITTAQQEMAKLFCEEMLYSLSN